MTPFTLKQTEIRAKDKEIMVTFQIYQICWFILRQFSARHQCSNISTEGKFSHRRWRGNQYIYIDTKSVITPSVLILQLPLSGVRAVSLHWRHNGLCGRNSHVTGEFPAQRAINAENVSIWWRHHVGTGNLIPLPVLVPTSTTATHSKDERD